MRLCEVGKARRGCRPSWQALHGVCAILLQEGRKSWAAREEVIRLQRIYNFLLFHAIILPLLDVMGFILHIFIIFRTNLLIGGPAHIAVFLPVSVFRRKGISNGVQTE